MDNKIKKNIYELTHGNYQVFGLIILSALFVCIARILAPIEMNWDEAIQLEAAHRLVKGFGLTSTFFPPPFSPDQIPSNINQSPIYQYVTWWPPGFSILVASLLFLGIPLASTLKILYATATLVGWFGWAILGSHCLSKSFKFGKVIFPAQLLIAAILPVFYTPGWQGTDIFLWFGVPFIVLMLFNSVSNNTKQYLVFSGLLFGFMVSIRYSSLFVAIAAFFILLQVNFPRIKSVFKSYSIFLGSSLLFILPLTIYNKLAGSNKPISSLYNNAVKSSTIPGLPEFVNLRSGGAGFVEAINSVLKSAATISDLSGLPLKPFATYLASHSIILNYVFGIFWLILIFLLPILVFKIAKTNVFKQTSPRLSVSIAIIPACLLLLLVASNFVQDYDFVGTGRYYIPAILSTVFIFYELSTARTKFAYSSIKLLFSIFVISFLAYNVIYRPLFLPDKKTQLVQSVLGSYLIYKHDYHYPSNKVITLYDETSLALRKLQKENPNALFFVQNYAFYVYDGQAGLRPIPVPNSDFWQRAYIDKAVKIFWVISKPNCSGICADHGSIAIPQLSSQPNLKNIYTNSKEKTKILGSDLPNRYKF